ncbi:MAG: preQ(1) synthase [Candidatus Omnitrophica bacterium]|nr:preQ(1) synthase [Candidatus Omnitrophota bacterium]
MIYKDRLTPSIEKKAKKTAGKTFSVADIVPGILQTIAYEYPSQPITVELKTCEFTCVCPFSGLPDFATLIIRYIPGKYLVELKSLKYYLYSFRNVKIYNEHAVNKILEDLLKALRPREITVIGEFTSRGGTENRVTAFHKSRK